MTISTEDRAFVATFEDGTLAPEQFRHRDHVRLAWLYLQQVSVPEALTAFSEGLKRLTRAQGQEGRYHETITYAFLFLINERMERGGRGDSWPTFAARNADLLNGGTAVLHTYYEAETLHSDLARRIFVIPRPEPQMDAERR